MKLLDLENHGTFRIVENDGLGACLFRSVCQALGRPQSEHKLIRASSVRHLLQKSSLHKELNKQGFYRYWQSRFIDAEIPQAYKSIQAYKKAVYKFYRDCMASENEPATMFELRAVADLLQFHFDIVMETSEPEIFRVHSCRKLCQVRIDRPRRIFLYSKQDGGHWEWLQPVSGCSEILTVSRRLHGRHFYSPEGLHEVNEWKGLNDRWRRIMPNRAGKTLWNEDEKDDWQGCANLYLISSSNFKEQRCCPRFQL